MSYPWKVPDDEMFDNIPIDGSSNKLRRSSYSVYSEDSLYADIADRIKKIVLITVAGSIQKIRTLTFTNTTKIIMLN